MYLVFDFGQVHNHGVLVFFELILLVELIEYKSINRQRTADFDCRRIGPHDVSDLYSSDPEIILGVFFIRLTLTVFAS